MSLTIPTTKDLADNILAQIEAGIGQTVPLLPKSFLRILSVAIAGVMVILYRYGAWLYEQQFVSTASIQETDIGGTTVSPLTEWGRLIGVGDPVPGVQAVLAIDITVLVQTGSIPAGTQFIRADTGVTYALTASVALDAATKTGFARAVADQGGGSGVGAIGNLQNGSIITFANPIANVARDVVVNNTGAPQEVAGADPESEASYRDRVASRFANPPQGGAYADYKAWAEEVEGITDAWPYTSDTPGIVEVYVRATPASSGDPDGIPTAAQLTAVEDSIEFDQGGLASRRPANAYVEVYPVNVTSFTVTVTGLVADDIPAAQATITEAIDQWFADREPFIPGLGILPRTDRLSKSGLSGVIEDVTSSINATFTSAELLYLGVPTPEYSLGKGEVAKQTGITWL